MKKGPTVYDVAEAAGVSTATVSFAFRRPDRVKQSTRDAVHTAARALGYVPSASARGLAAGRTGALGMVTWDLLASGSFDRREGGTTGWAAPEVDDGLRLYPRYVDEVQHGVELAAWRNGYALMMGGGNHDNNDAIIIDIAGRVDGLVILPHTISTQTITLISERIPVVLLSDTYEGNAFSKITVDNSDGVRCLVRHLIDVHDTRTVEFFGSTHSVEFAQRFEAVQTTLAGRNLPVPRAPLGNGDRAAEVVGELERSDLPDAIVCGTDAAALDLMDALTERGIGVPEDLIVTGFDGIAASQLSTPRLTTVRQPMRAMGVAAVELLLEQLKARDQPLSRHFPVQLVVRESCGCTPGA